LQNPELEQFQALISATARPASELGQTDALKPDIDEAAHSPPNTPGTAPPVETKAAEPPPLLEVV
jgi:hypothetical protein